MPSTSEESPRRASFGRMGVVLLLPMVALAIAWFVEARVTGASAPPARAAAPAPERRILRVCADPNNLPFSNEKREGFENRLAELIANELGAELRYTWWAQRRGFIRNTLRAGECDLVPGIPSSHEMVLATRPYYRSTYVFVQRRGERTPIRSFDDERLRALRVGVHMVGDDGANAPPAHALARRGMTRNVRGFSLYGDYSRPNPPADIIHALAVRQIDVAVVWGPLAGYFAPRESVALEVTPVSPQIDVPFLPFVFDIAMGVRRDDPGLKVEVDGILHRRRPAVDSILAAYGVPLVGTVRRR